MLIDCILLYHFKLLFTPPVENVVCFTTDPDLEACDCVKLNPDCPSMPCTNNARECNEDGVCTCKPNYRPPDCCNCTETNNTHIIYFDQMRNECKGKFLIAAESIMSVITNVRGISDSHKVIMRHENYTINNYYHVWHFD